VLLLAVVRSAAASSCVLLAKYADTAHARVRWHIGVQRTSSSLIFGVQKRNVKKPIVLAWVLELALVLLRNLRKQTQMKLNAQFVWSH
jgi:hypothetical protein